MIVRGRIVVLVLTVGLAAAAHAEMMPVCGMGVAPRPLEGACGQVAPQDADLPSLREVLPIADLGVAPITCLPDAQSNPGGTQSTGVFSDDQGSFSLCLYALLGLGLCRSAPLVRKLSLGGVPDWYHHGGPLQIGHSHAVGPDCLCQAAICFIQPERITQDCLPEYYRGTIASLLRKSQFTPTTLASRGPPCMS